MQSQLKCLHGIQGPQKPGSTIFRKKPPDSLKFFGPATPLWVLQPSVIMHLVSKDPLLASAVFARSLKVLGWQPGAPKIREHPFPKKKMLIFLKFIGPVTALWVLQPSQIMHMVSTEPLLARAVLTKLIKVLGWQAGAQNPGSTTFRKKKTSFFLKFIGPLTHPWVLYPSEIMNLGYTELLLARAVFTRSIKVPGWQPGAPKPREHDFPEKNVLIF